MVTLKHISALVIPDLVHALKGRVYMNFNEILRGLKKRSKKEN